MTLINTMIVLKNTGSKYHVIWTTTDKMLWTYCIMIFFFLQCTKYI